MRRVSGLALLLLVACARPPASDEAVPLGRDSLARFVDVPAGADCAHGGERLEVGIDADGDGALGDDEVQSTAMLCDGAPGASAAPDLLRLVPGALESCGGPGVRVDIGRDLDGDLVLDDEEVRDSGDLCDGAAGAPGGAALVDVSDASSCPASGRLIRVGLDGDGDGALSEEEVLTSRAVCDGAAAADAGPAGADGVATLVEVSAEEVECEAGGQRVRVGRDADGSGTLAIEEVSESVVLCNGIAGQAGDPGPGSGVTEGSSDAPVSVAVSSFADLYAGHTGSVAGGGRSYYSFTTRSEHGPMPYTIALLEAESDLVVSVRAGDAAGAAVPVRCRDELVLAAMARVCETDALAAAAPHVIVVRDTRNVANAYVLTVSAGASQGTALAPVELDASGLVDADLVTRASLRELGESFYRFTPTLTDHHTLSLENVDAPDGDPLLGFELYDGEVRSDRLLATCAGAACPTPRLTASTAVIVRVLGGAPRAAAFDLRLSRGDDVTPEVPLGVVTPAAPILQLMTEAAGGYSIFLAFEGFTVAANATREHVIFECQGNGGDACLVPLEGSTRYYLFTDAVTEGREVYVQKSAGQEGSPDSPVPLTLDVPHAGSTDQESYGDNGSVPAQSYYSFTTAEAGPYALDYAWVQPGFSHGIRLDLYRDLYLSEPVVQQQVVGETRRRVFVTEPLAAGTTYFVVFRSYDALTFELRVSAGDGDLPLLPLDGSSLSVTVPSTDESWHRIELAETGPVDVAASGLDGNLTLRFFTDAVTSELFREWTLATEGTHTVVLPAGTSYLQLATVGLQTVEVSATLPSISPLTLDVPLTRAGLGVAGSDWYRFEVAVEGTHTLTLTPDASGGGYNGSAVQLFDALADRPVDASAIGALTTPLLPSRPMPAGTWLLRVRNPSDALSLDYDVQVSAP